MSVWQIKSGIDSCSLSLIMPMMIRWYVIYLISSPTHNNNNGEKWVRDKWKRNRLQFVRILLVISHLNGCGMHLIIISNREQQWKMEMYRDFYNGGRWDWDDRRPVAKQLLFWGRLYPSFAWFAGMTAITVPHRHYGCVCYCVVFLAHEKFIYRLARELCLAT